MVRCQTFNQEKFEKKRNRQRKDTPSYCNLFFERVSPLQFYDDNCRAMSLRSRADMPPKALFLLVVVTFALLPSKLDTKESIT